MLDEAERLLEPSFEAELATVLGTLPGERQTLLFSATMTKALVALQKVGEWGCEAWESCTLSWCRPISGPGQGVIWVW